MCARDHRNGAMLVSPIYAELGHVVIEYARLFKARFNESPRQVRQRKRPHFQCRSRAAVKYQIIEYLHAPVATNVQEPAATSLADDAEVEQLREVLLRSACRSVRNGKEKNAVATQEFSRIR